MLQASTRFADYIDCDVARVLLLLGNHWIENLRTRFGMTVVSVLLGIAFPSGMHAQTQGSRTPSPFTSNGKEVIQLPPVSQPPAATIRHIIKQPSHAEVTAGFQSRLPLDTRYPIVAAGSQQPLPPGWPDQASEGVKAPSVKLPRKTLLFRQRLNGVEIASGPSTFARHPGASCYAILLAPMGFSLTMMVEPPGTFTFFDDRRFTAFEAIDLLNDHLIPRGAILVRNEQRLILVSSQEPINGQSCSIRCRQ